MHVHHSEEPCDDSTRVRLLVGYSAYTLEPVLASAAATALEMDVHVDDLSGLELEVASEGTLSAFEAILHHSLTVPGNLRAVKHLLIKRNWEEAFAEGDVTVEHAKNLAQESAQSLYHGHSPVVVGRIKPPTTVQVPCHKMPNLEQCVNPDQLHGPKNRRFREILPNIIQHHYFNFATSTFMYQAPYMSNTRYPSRLYLDLAGFAKAHPLEKLNATAMLFAARLWVDIVDSPTKCKETYAREPVPEVSLAVFLIYFEHWLKAHEHLQCIAYIHPFRLIQRIYANDILTQGGSRDLLIDESEIDSDRVRDLVYEAEATDPNFPIDECVDLYPFMVNGTKMVQPQCLNERFRLSPTEQALLGMPDLRILSHPSLPTTDSVDIQIAMPEAITRINFCKVSPGGYCLSNFFDAAKDDPTSLFGDSLKSGTLWTHEFQMYTHRSDLPKEAYIKRKMIDVWPQLLDRRMAWLETLGVLGKVRVRTGEDGLPGYLGMPLEEESRNINDAAMEEMVDRALKDPRNRLVDEAKRYPGCYDESAEPSEDE
ncbi:uncharacterized protein BKA55DRAFT_547889 [Fusarium redolens]|uniref:Uncharacterized protein n=1 Tax=Fusarium redolens TaxID=48865 RepID=A0A9P9KVA6_FUSRE|nr:uncharacterized protein BKA55DRAFT_547889 [Fusarium redolens]KAH7269126.1 hypothetical protein BKA55DRAFT_547889 [Fusarium redolens]